MTTQIGIYDHITGEQIIRDMTAEELAERAALNAAYAQEKAERLAQEESFRQTKISAYQKLGLSAEEIESLLPSPKLVEK